MSGGLATGRRLSTGLGGNDMRKRIMLIALRRFKAEERLPRYLMILLYVLYPMRYITQTNLAPIKYDILTHSISVGEYKLSLRNIGWLLNDSNVGERFEITSKAFGIIEIHRLPKEPAVDIEKALG